MTADSVVMDGGAVPESGGASSPTPEVEAEIRGTDVAEITSVVTAAALKRQYLAETSNAAFLPLFEDTSRYLVLKGGGGSGKSIFAGRKILERAVNEGNHRFLVCRKVGRTLRNSCFQQLIGELHDYYPDVKYKANQTDMRILFTDSQSEIIFSGLDDVEKLKSIYNITGIWIEEASELLESDFNQLDIRLRGETEHYKQMILTFNPINILHWLKTRFFDRTPDNATVHESTYRDNRFLDDDAKKVLEDFRDTDEYYYAVYCLGQWGVTGKTVFPAGAVTERLGQLGPALKTGFFDYDYNGAAVTNIRFIEEENGPVRIYGEPQPGRPYVIGGDTAGEGSDCFVLQCVDNISLEQVATFRRQRLDEDVFARQAYCLGLWFNQALIALETNWSTYPVLELERLRYPRQYVRETFDRYTHALKSSFGFRTDVKTRPVIIANLIKAVREDIALLRDRSTLEEMLTFVRNESMRPEAEAGAHDDCIMALAIALFARSQQRTYVLPAVGQVWTADMWEDYQNGDRNDRREMIKRWGKPNYDERRNH